MRRDEVARKISAGAVDYEALAWREGMDDWLAVKHIPELLALFPAAQAPAGQPAPAQPAVQAIAQAPVQPAARAEMAPIGARQVMSLDDYAQPLEVSGPAIAVSPLKSIPPSAAPQAPKPPGWAQMFALVSGGALIMTIGVVLGVRVLAPTPAPAPAAAPATAATPAAAAAAPAQGQADDPSRTIELDMQAIDGASAANAPRRTGSGDRSKPAAGSGKQLTEEQKAMLARMGGSLDQGPNLNAPSESTRPSGGGAGTGQLTAQQLKDVVKRGSKNLQRCYEVALRGAQSDETVRMDVDIDVSPNGNVTSVRISGKGLPGMEECITRTVKMWRFPSSGESTQTRFPVLFQPGA
jgi:GYF domain 2